jgi:hypothetical protein
MNFKPNQEQVMSLVRDALSISGTTLTILGYMNDQQWGAISGVVMMVVPVVWSMFNHTHANAVAVAAAIPDVAEVVVKPTIKGRELKESAGSTPEAQVSVQKGTLS